MSELKALVVDLQKQLGRPFDVQGEASNSQFEARRATLNEFCKQSRLASARVLAVLSERVAVLEARH